MDISKVKKFAVENGYVDVVKLPKWRGYDVYEPIMSKKENALVGPPLIILVNGEDIRMSTDEEAYQNLDETISEEDD